MEIQIPELIYKRVVVMKSYSRILIESAGSDLVTDRHSVKCYFLVNTLKNHFFKTNRPGFKGYASGEILDIEYFENLQ